MENAKHYTFSPPIRGYCPICAVKHDNGQPHFENSLYYLIKTGWGKADGKTEPDNKK